MLSKERNDFRSFVHNYAKIIIFVIKSTKKRHSGIQKGMVALRTVGCLPHLSGGCPASAVNQSFTCPSLSFLGGMTPFCTNIAAYGNVPVGQLP